MYKKKSKLPVIVAVIAVVLAFLLMYLTKMVSENQSAEKLKMESASQYYDVLLYKTSEAVITFDEKWLKSQNDSEAVLSIPESELVSLFVTPKEGRTLKNVEIVDYAFFEIDSFLSETSSGDIRVNFVMPANEIIINFNFTKEVMEQTQTEIETETEKEGNPFGLTLHGLTADIITSYNGLFDDKDFLWQLGDTLGMDDETSAYKNVTDVTFSQEEYEGKRDSDKVYHYIYFNEDSEWKVLSTYYMNEGAYVFTDPYEVEETESEAITVNDSVTTGSVTTGYSNSHSGGSSTTVTTTTAFDIMQVSTVFLAFVEDQEAFYEKTFRYVVKNELTGTIIGTMSEYEIFPEKQEATFKITLSSGDTIHGVFDKKKDSYSFQGL